MHNLDELPLKGSLEMNKGIDGDESGIDNSLKRDEGFYLRFPNKHIRDNQKEEVEYFRKHIHSFSALSTYVTNAKPLCEDSQWLLFEEAVKFKKDVLNARHEKTNCGRKDLTNMDSSIGKMCLGQDIIEIFSDQNEGLGDWDLPEYKDTAGSGGKKEPEALIEIDLLPKVCKIGKGSQNKKKIMENILYFNNGVGPSSSVGTPLTQEEAEKWALAHNISIRYEMLEEVRPTIETLSYNDKYKKLLDEIWADKVRLDEKIKPKEERAMLGRGDILKEDRNITMINYTEAEVIGRLVNVLCQVGFTTLSAKFLIMEIPVDRDAPIVVGCRFLDTIEGNIDILNRILTTFDGLFRQTFRVARSKKSKSLRATQMMKKTMYVVPTGRVVVPTGRYVVFAGNVIIVSSGRLSLIPTGRVRSLGSDNESDDASVHSEATNAQQQPNIQPQIITIVSNNNGKFPYLKKDEYEKARRKIDFDNKESARFNKKKDAIKEGVANIYNMITGADIKEASTAGDAGEFALMGVTSEDRIVLNLLKISQNPDHINTRSEIRRKAGSESSVFKNNLTLKLNLSRIQV
nr:hypothetical protein [Tanacetum cinerariifolium]